MPDGRYVDEYIEDHEWWFQQKLDGHRVLISVGPDSIESYNRHGKRRTYELPGAVVRQFLDFDFDTTWIFDGELVGSTFWVFDVLCDQHLDLSEAYRTRLQVLEQFFAIWERRNDNVRLVHTARTPAEKRRLMKAVELYAGEGFVLKHQDAPYLAGRISPYLLKAKRWFTADCVIADTDFGGKVNAVLKLWDPEAPSVPKTIHTANGNKLLADFGKGEWVTVGKVSAWGKGLLKRGDVVEVRYAYATDSRRLYIPSIVRRRDDKPPIECTIDQIRHTTKKIFTPNGR